MPVRYRIRAALNVLRGRPTMYGMVLTVARPIELTEHHVVLGNTFEPV